MSGRVDVVEGGQALLAKAKASVIVVKMGPYGCAVIDRNGTASVPNSINLYFQRDRGQV